MSEQCPCCSGKLFNECCQPIIDGTKKAEFPEQLMRSRYTAYTQCKIDYIVETTHPTKRQTLDLKQTKQWAETSDWKKLEVLNAPPCESASTEGFVEFRAYYNDTSVHEYSRFLKEEDKWYYIDGQYPKPQTVRNENKLSRNDPCHCGSGKKYKKCCL